MLKHSINCECSTRVRRLTYKFTRTLSSCGSHKFLYHCERPLGNHTRQLYYMHSACLDNHLYALEGRVGLCVPYPKNAQLKRLEDQLKRVSSAIGSLKPLPRQAIVDSFSGTKRERYRRAKEKLDKFGQAYDGRLKMFVKQEAIKYDENKTNPACRAIQFRDFQYGLDLATFIRPFEHKFYKLRGVAGIPATRTIMKGIDNKTSARTIRMKMSAFKNGCWNYSLDMHRCDAHFTEDLLKIEHRAYLRCFAGDRRLKKLLQQQLINRGSGRTKDGHFSYKVRGGRASGDFNTGCGNIMVVSSLLVLLCEDIRQIYHCQTDYINNGDDSNIFADAVIPEDFFSKWFLDFGFTVEMEPPTRMESFMFCQSRLVELPSGPTMVRDWERVIAKTMTNPKFAQFHPAKLLKTIALAELSLCYGCPILDKFFRVLIRDADSNMSKRGLRDGGLIKDPNWMSYRHTGSLAPDWDKLRPYVPITHESRISFEKAFGVSPTHQVILEDELDDFRISSFKFEKGQELNVKRWLYDPIPRELLGSYINPQKGAESLILPC